MALQGTIDSFALADVLRLLAGSRKTGRLVVNGERGSSSLWLSGGDLVGGSTSGDPTAIDLVDIVFDVLRYETGSFIFEADALCANPLDPAPVGAVLDRAEAYLAEWRDIVAVVPSMSSWITLAAELPHPEVVVDQACWTSIVAVGSGSTVTSLAEALGLGELPACRLVRALVHAGFVRVGSAMDDPEALVGLSSSDLAAPAVVDLVAPAPVTADAPRDEAHADGFDSFDSFDHFDDATPGDVEDELALPSLTISGLSDDPFAPESYPAPAEEPESGAGGSWLASEDAQSDVSYGLSMLSPKAAQAVAAAEANAAAEAASGQDEDGVDLSHGA